MGRVRLILAATLLATQAAAQDAPVVFRVRDRVGSAEIEEATVIYIDGKLVGAFQLDAEHTDMVLTVRVAARETHEYALCGRLVARGPGGKRITVDFNVGGTLEDVEGREFEAVASTDFSEFALVDTTLGREASRITPGKPGACAPATS